MLPVSNARMAPFSLGMEDIVSDHSLDDAMDVARDGPAAVLHQGPCTRRNIACSGVGSHRRRSTCSGVSVPTTTRCPHYGSTASAPDGLALAVCYLTDAPHAT